MEGRGIIALFARHPTAANLLMMMVILLGFASLSRLNIQFFPDFGVDMVTVDVEWPGAAAEDVDSTIVQAIEPEVRFLDGVKRVRSSSVEGRAVVAVEFIAGTDMQAALADVETGVGQVKTLPEESERPEIRRVVVYDPIARIILSGPFPEAALKAAAKRIRDALLDRGIQKVDLFGARDEEIWVEIRPETLLRLDLTLGDVAARIRETSQDIPSGSVRGATEKQIRSLGLIKGADALGGVEIKALPTGEKVLLRDIAALSEAFDDDQAEGRRRGDPAVELHVQRALTADALDQARIMNAVLADARAWLPSNMKLERHEVNADLIQSRIDLLLRNGISGLVLVVAVLFLFLNARVAFWVAAGIPISLMATMLIMLASGQSINMISLFGMIMAIGIVVDEAIVVGEHAEHRFRNGMPPLAAAEAGAQRMAPPVLSSALTTVAAFTPLLVIGDIIGTLIAAIPLVVISMIGASVVECFLILPAHLHGALKGAKSRVSGLRARFDDKFDYFRRNPFRRAVVAALKWRYLTVAVALAAFILSIGMIQGGRVSFQFFPSPESDRINANVVMIAGTPRADTAAMLDELERAAAEAEAKLTDGKGGLIHVTFAKAGVSPGRSGEIAAMGDNLGGMVLELVPSDERRIRTNEMVRAWRAAVKAQAGLETLTIVAITGGPPGREIDVRLSGGETTALKSAALEVKALLGRYAGVSDVEDDLPYGKLEEIINVTPRGRSLGFATDNVARQLRDAFEGGIARRFARGDEEVVVRVQFPRAHADAAGLENLYLRAPGGAEMPMAEVVSRRTQRGFSRIRREDGLRQVAITGEIDEGVTSSDKVLEALKRDGLNDIAQRFGLKASLAGKAEEQADTLADMKLGATIGLVTIFIILAWVFGSFTRPIVVMAIIPLSLVGAVLGHWLLGYDLTILSMVALLGLAGIVVNDSIILVSTIDGRIKDGQSLDEALVEGACDRVRAVILTSATTIGGLLPLLFERSFQAQFLIPMAVTITFGLLVTTLLVLGVVPALIGIQEDAGRALRRYIAWRPHPADGAAE